MTVDFAYDVMLAVEKKEEQEDKKRNWNNGATKSKTGNPKG